MPRTFVACRKKVFNRGKPPVAFLDELVDWGVAAPNEIFSPNSRTDIYSAVKAELGPWANDLERRAAMLEALRVLAGFESSWNWKEGVDTTNPHSNTACTEEAGILQCSGDSMRFDASLKELLKTVSGRTDCDTFRATTKANHKFALEYCARLLRFTIRHHGPVRDGHIQPELRRDAMAELLGFLQAESVVADISGAPAGAKRLRGTSGPTKKRAAAGAKKRKTPRRKTSSKKASRKTTSRKKTSHKKAPRKKSSRKVKR